MLKKNDEIMVDPIKIGQRSGSTDKAFKPKKL